MKRLMFALVVAAVTACGGSSEPGCGLCGTWYSRYDANGSLIAHDANRSLSLRTDQSFTEVLGTQPGLTGNWAATSTSLVLSYNGTGPETGVIKGDSIAFPTHNIFSRRIYER
jgi:hypothetical protein